MAATRMLRFLEYCRNPPSEKPPSYKSEEYSDSSSEIVSDMSARVHKLNI